MASNQVDDYFDNKQFMDFDEALFLIKTYFTQEMPMFILIDEFRESTGYWGIKYSYKEIFIFISCGRGYLENEFTIKGQNVSLIEIDERMEKIEVASKKNIFFTLSVINTFLKANKYILTT